MRLKATIMFLAATWSAVGASLDHPFAEGWFVNSIRTITDPSQIQSRDTNAVSIFAGGNVGIYPDPSWALSAPPQAQITLGGANRTIYLAQSAFGQMVAGTLGFPGSTSGLLNEGFQLLTNSAPYAVFTSLTGAMTPAGGGAWDIRFPGVINPTSGQSYTNSTWFEATNHLAELRFRAALRIDPFSVEAARALLTTIRQRVVPKSFAGNNAFVRASLERLTANNPALAESGLLETNALAFYEAASHELIVALGSLPDAALLDGSYPYVPPTALTNDVQLLLHAFTRAVALQGDTLVKLGQLKYFSTYTDPASGTYNPQAFLDFLDRRIAGLQQQFLAVNALQSLPIIQASDLNKAGQRIQELVRFRSSVAAGRLAFKGALVTELGADQPVSYTYREYAPEFVPFLWDPNEFAQYPNSFRKLLADAQALAVRAESLDASAANHIRQTTLDDFQLRQALASIKNRYNGELGELCGFIRLESGEMVPDVIFGLFAPGDRESFHQYSGAGESKGRIYLQWQNVLRAETQVRITVQELTNVLSNIQKKQEVARDIAQGQTNIANLVLQNGEKLGVLDKEEGEAKAAAIKTEARLKTQAAIRSGLIDFGKQFGSGFANPIGFAQAAETGFRVWDSARTSFEVAEVEAGLQRRIADIQAQKTKIVSTERATIIFEQTRADLLRTEEAIHALFLESERQKLNILMAEQSLDMERLELANIAGRVHYLLQEYLDASQLENENPLSSPDYRLLRDLAVRDAEETYLNAQERAYLAAKAGQYRVNRGQQASTVNSLLGSIVSSRRGSSLVTALNNLQQRVDDLFLQQGTQTSVQNPVISVRHFLVQNNFVIVTNQFGDWDASTASLESFAIGVSLHTISDAAWLNFLRSHMVTNTLTGERRLEFSFATSVNRPNRADFGAPDAMQNPLFNTALINGLITYTPTLPNAFGVRVNIRGRNLSYNPVQEILVELRQQGASYIRSKSWVCDTDGAALRIWNLAPTLAQLKASVNGFQAEGSPQFHERSPANDRWIFSISSFNGANATVLSQLDRITDLEIAFSIRGFTPPDCN
jgi:hypothetical protein